MDSLGFASYNRTQTILSRREFRLQHQMAVQISRSTRRVLRLAYRQQRLLARINRILLRAKHRKENLENRADVRRKRRAIRNRRPQLRVRTRDNYGVEALPKFYYRTLARPSTVVQYPIQGWSVTLGDRGHMTDYSPHTRLDPPRNNMWAGRERRNSTSASAQLLNKGTYAEIFIPKCKFAEKGLLGQPLTLDVNQDIGFDQAHVDEVLIAAMAKANANDLNTNEYLFEWRQVFRLLLDPYRTALRLARSLDRWTKRDAWIWVPQRIARKLSNGDVLVSQRPLGGVLMSMRTRRTLSPVGVSKKILTEASNRWLQYRYGIMPLAKDITIVMGDWLSPKLHSRMRSVSARVKVEHEKKQFMYSRTVSPLVFNFKLTYEVGEFYSGKQWYKMLEEPPMSFKLGIHPTQYARVLWNAIPYSFVADWVVNIDQWLTARIQAPWLSYEGNYVTRKIYERVTAHLLNIHTTSSVNDTLTLSSLPVATCTRELVKRAIDIPGAYAPPVSKAWRSVKNAITALTLLPGVLRLSGGSRRGI